MPRQWPSQSAMTSDSDGGAGFGPPRSLCGQIAGVVGVAEKRSRNNATRIRIGVDAETQTTVLLGIGTPR